MNYKVSVIIPAYNAELYILQSINSILNQLYSNIEIVVTDDCSTDNTFEVLQSIKDKRLKLFKNKINSGVSATLNNCITKSTGELIAVMHADDIAHPERIKLQVQFLEDNINVSAVGSDWLNIDENNYPLGLGQVTIGQYDLLVNALLKKNPFPHPSAMYRRSAVLKAGLYNSSYDGMEDHDLWMKMTGLGLYFGNIPKPLLKYRLHSKQISQNYSKKDIQKNFDIFIDFVKRLGLQRSEEDIIKYCNICNKSYFTENSNDFNFFLQFFSEVLNNFNYLNGKEKNKIKIKFIKTVIKHKARRKLQSYFDYVYLIRWYFMN